MDNHRGMEREVSIKELLWRFLLGWRKIVCLGIIFGILLTVFQYVRGMNKSQKNLEPEVSMEEELTENEIQEIENVQVLRQEILKYRKYLESSAAMKIDAYNEPIVELQCMVQTDYVMNYTQDIFPDYTEDIISLYTRYVLGENFRKNLIKSAALDITPKDLKELTGVGRENNMIYITIGYPDSEKLPEIAGILKELLNKQEVEYQKIGSHKLLFTNESQYNMVNDSLVDKRSNILTKIATLNVQVNQLENALSEQQKEFLNKDENIKEQDDDQKVAGIQIKHIVLGVALGIMVAGAWIICGVLFTGKLQSADEIRSLYGEPLLGEIYLESDKKSIFSAIDKKLLALKNRRRKKLSLEQQVDVVCANLAITCKRQGITSVYVTGSECIEETVLKLLKEKIRSQGIQVQSGENMYYDASSMKRGGEIGNILFVERIGMSLYDEIYNEIKLVKEKDMKVLGLVLLE